MRARRFALAAAVLALLALPAVPAQGDAVAWLAGRLGVAVEDLPERFDLRTFEVADGRVVEQARRIPLATLASHLQGALADASADGSEAAPWAGAGVGGPGVQWSGLAVGPRGQMDCASYDVVETHLLGPTASGGTVNATVRLALPTQDFFTRAGVAVVQVQVLPEPKAGPVAVAAPAGAEAEFLSGHGQVSCGESFTLVVTVGVLAGDGDLHSPLRPEPPLA